jgi:hypothetical protein
VCSVKFTDKHFTVEVCVAKIYAVEIQYAKTYARSGLLSSFALKIVGNKICSMAHTISLNMMNLLNFNMVTWL